MGNPPAKLLNRLTKNGISLNQLNSWLETIAEPQIAKELLYAQGLPEFVELKSSHFLKTAISTIDEQTFCFVDIETNGGNPKYDQIIEIGAIKYRDGVEIDSFDMLVHAETIPKYVTKVTGISRNDLKKAPHLKEVLYAFKQFLGDAIFVAHDAKFDYGFISDLLVRIGLMPLLNRRLCTISLAERSIKSERYGLAYLNETLKLYPQATHHRALSDAYTSLKLFEKSLENIPKNIKRTEELLRFSTEPPRLNTKSTKRGK